MKGLPMFEQDEPLRSHEQNDAEASPSPEVPAQADNADDSDPLAERVRLALRRVKDPDINLNIVDMGLIYDIVVDGGDVRIDMSLTSPGCPSGPEIMGNAERELSTVEGITSATINLVWSPPWTPDRIEPRVRAYLGF